MKKIAVIIGHNPIHQGAEAIAPIGKSEFDFNSELANLIEQESINFPFEIELFYRKFKNSYTKEIKEVYKLVDLSKCDYSMELHFNSAVFTVSGSEVLSSGSKKSKHFARLIQKEQVKLFDRTKKENRGVKIRKKGSRGYLSLISGKAAAIIVEPFFGSNRKDCNLMHTIGTSQLAVSYLKAMDQL